MLPTVAIIGRPNTGKSTLFNRIVGRRKAIESAIAGTTRDHISHRIDLEKVSFLLIDTGGIGASKDTDFEQDVTQQSLLALEHADVIIFTINSREEVTADDRRILELLRKGKRKHVAIIVALTKVDTGEKVEEVKSNFQDMAIGNHFIGISAPHNIGVPTLLQIIERELVALHFTRPEKITEDKNEASDDDTTDEELFEDEKVQSAFPENTTPKIAIIGRPNVGKSSIVNALMSDAKRSVSPLLVSPIAGTTRDSTDTDVLYEGKPYTLIDTAGLRKNARREDEIERFSAMRTLSSIERADIVVLVLDASERPNQQDKRIASLAIESGKGLLILLNKIDQMKGEKRTQAIEAVTKMMDFISKFVAIIPCSAVTKEGLTKLFMRVEAIQKSRILRISTRDLMRWFEQHVHGKPLKGLSSVKYMTQAKDIPPTFVLFTRNSVHIRTSELRYLENRLRQSFGFDGTPINWITREAEEQSAKRKIR